MIHYGAGLALENVWARAPGPLQEDFSAKETAFEWCSGIALEQIN